MTQNHKQIVNLLNGADYVDSNFLQATLCGLVGHTVFFRSVAASAADDDDVSDFSHLDALNIYLHYSVANAKVSRTVQQLQRYRLKTAI